MLRLLRSRALAGGGRVHFDKQIQIAVRTSLATGMAAENHDRFGRNRSTIVFVTCSKSAACVMECPFRLSAYTSISITTIRCSMTGADKVRGAERLMVESHTEESSG